MVQCCFDIEIIPELIPARASSIRRVPSAKAGPIGMKFRALGFIQREVSKVKTAGMKSEFNIAHIP